ncbi:EcsC family protein [Streptomyces antibioticus]|uniref:EcsC family protein n=1 Tax=Streptomyces antibioticus TaxID=1890 RepID=UPI002259D8E2|nr:EcsC family protein [Streptomyces antibioticus]MCX4741800.1 EcsC family protein [Streptomyces antibioticus]
MTLSAYEQQEWDKLQKRKAASLSKEARKILPQSARERLASLGQKVKNAPGADKAAGAYGGAARGLGKAVGDTASRTVSKKRVVEQYRRAGHHLAGLDEIRQLDLHVVDEVARPNLLRYGHALSAAATGLGSAAAVTGGEVLASAGSVAGAGAGAAPGLGTVAGAMLVDTAVMLALSTRAVAATALSYGYDPSDPEEEIFVMSVIALGMSTGTSAKTAAYAELSHLTQLLVRNAPWAKLNEKVLTKIVQRFAAEFTQRLTKRKLGQFVPIAGMAVGAGLSYALLDRIAVSARDAYRERFLIEKSGGDLTGDLDFGDADLVQDDDAIGVFELLREEDALPTSTPPDSVAQPDN